MLRQARLWLASLVLGWTVMSVSAQTPVQPAQTPTPSQQSPAQAPTTNAVPGAPAVAANAPASNAVAATVNGQVITELAVQRSLKRVEASKRAAARPELVDYLVDNVIVEQYLQQVPIKVDAPEVENRLTQMKDELKKHNQDFATFITRLELTEAELREQIAADIRWDKFATAQATEKALQDLFAGNKDMFDGSTVRARHILLPAAPDSPAKLLKIKQNIEAAVAKGLVDKLPANADALTREKERIALLDQAFVVNTQESVCPSKSQGGDVGSFRRAGFMVEPFAKVAFALKPYEMSDVVQTQFGYHLILVLEHKPGIQVKYEDVKDDVKEVFCDRLREAVLAQMKPRAKIVITPQPKP
jgi:peptidyl-prolyl cis-trans isomerase C